MTFMHKLSRRLAMLKDRWVVFSTAALALATLSACEKPIALTGPDASAVWRLVISPKILTLRQNQTADFTAIGLTSSGNPASGGVSWTVTSGAITDTSTSNGQHYGRFQAASDTGKVVVVVREVAADRKSTRLNSSHSQISYAVFCLKKKKTVSVRSMLRSRSPSLSTTRRSCRRGPPRPLAPTPLTRTAAPPSAETRRMSAPSPLVSK